MRRYLTKPPEVTLRDEAAMRAFYAGCGISPETTEAAILARRNKSFEETKPSIFKGKSRKRRAPGNATRPPGNASGR
jgi:hypothetical protein